MRGTQYHAYIIITGEVLCICVSVNLVKRGLLTLVAEIALYQINIFIIIVIVVAVVVVVVVSESASCMLTWAKLQVPRIKDTLPPTTVTAIIGFHTLLSGNWQLTVFRWC